MALVWLLITCGAGAATVAASWLLLRSLAQRWWGLVLLLALLMTASGVLTLLALLFLVSALHGMA